MTIQELATSPESPLSEQQKKELQEEYFANMSELNEKIRKMQQAMNEKTSQLEAAERSWEQHKRTAIGCMESVKAMLEYSNACGATHRMKSFYGFSAGMPFPSGEG